VKKTDEEVGGGKPHRFDIDTSEIIVGERSDVFRGLLRRLSRASCVEVAKLVTAK
jgi:hypothetical protein